MNSPNCFILALKKSMMSCYRESSSQQWHNTPFLRSFGFILSILQVLTYQIC